MSLKIDAWNITSTGYKVKKKKKSTGNQIRDKEESLNILKYFGVSF